MITVKRVTSRWIGAAFGFDESAAIRLPPGLFRQRTQDRGGAGTALHGDQQSCGDEVAERVVDVVGEAAEHDRRVLPAEPGGKAAHLRFDRGRAGGHRGVDRADRLVAGDQHVAQVLDPRRRARRCAARR